MFSNLELIFKVSLPYNQLVDDCTTFSSGSSLKS